MVTVLHMRRGPKPLRPSHGRARELDALSRRRALTDPESRELERLLHADYCRRLRADRPIPRGIA